MNINDLTKEQLIAAIINGDDLQGLNAFIEMPKNILSDTVPDTFPDSHIPEYVSPGGMVKPKITIPFGRYLFHYANDINTLFIIAYRIPDGRPFSGFSDSEVRIFLDYFCDETYSNLYTEKEGKIRHQEYYRK